MGKFRTKPFEIEAVQFTGDNEAEVQEFAGAEFFNTLDEDDKVDDPDLTAQVFDKLHSTWVGVKDGQWIIRGQKGEYYPCDPEIFAAKYESIDPPARTMEAARPMTTGSNGPAFESSADAIRRGADWVSDTGGTVTSSTDINRNPQQGGRFHNR